MAVEYNDKPQNLKQRHYFQPLKRHIGARIEPILRKKSGFDIALLENWPQIVGQEMAQICMAFKITWPRQKAGEKAKLAMLSIACEGLAALKIQHQADEIIEKINLFFGFQAIGKIKIIQKSLPLRPDLPPAHRALSQKERAWLEEQTGSFEDDMLRAAMSRFGENILATIDPRLKKSMI